MGTSVETTARIVIHPDIRRLHPSPFNAIQSALADEVPFAIVTPDHYNDQSPNLLIPDVPSGTSFVVVPGFISGRHAEETLVAITKVGHDLAFSHPSDERSPRTRYIHYFLFDCEGRGNKPTMLQDGELIPHAELHYAFYIADMLKRVGFATSFTILDPHDEVSVAALHAPVVTISALPEIGRYMFDEGIVDSSAGLVIPDDGAIRRSLFFSETTGIPIIARIIKRRINGTPTIYTVYGQNNIPGRQVIFVDDAFATGKTLYTDGAAVRKLGAAGTVAAVTHVKGVNGAGDMLFQKMHESRPILDHLIITNSTPYYTDVSGIPNVHVVDVNGLLIRAARAAVTHLPNIGAMTKTLSGDIYPMTSSIENLRFLHASYPHLAPDYGQVAVSS